MFNKLIQFTKVTIACALLFSTATHAADKNNMSTTTIKLTTNQGEITLELDAEKAPNTVKNFVTYVEEGFYEWTSSTRMRRERTIGSKLFQNEYEQP